MDRALHQRRLGVQRGVRTEEARIGWRGIRHRPRHHGHHRGVQLQPRQHLGIQEFCCGGSGGADASIVRYNISQNDGSSNSVLPHQAYVKTGGTAQWYNNDVYLSSTDNAPIFGDAAPTGLSYSNNIIYKLGTGGYGTGGTWSHNTFYGNHPTSEPADSAKLTTDPLFVSPGTGGAGRSTATGYKLKTGSPAIGSGVLISGNGGLDFFGNAVSSTAASDRGAYNGAPQ